MSDLTKAIHAQMDTWARSGREETIALAADRYDGAIRMLLGWADRMESGIGGPSAVGKAFADQLREVLADALGVSGEDRSVPTPAPREYRAGDNEPPVGTKLTGGGFTWTRHGRSWQTPEGGVLNWVQLTEFCPRLSEVVTPAPREPRVWRHGVHANIDADVTEVVGGRSNVLYTREPRTQFMWRGQKSSGVGFVYGVASLLADEGHVTEVVTPEGTS